MAKTQFEYHGITPTPFQQRVFDLLDRLYFGFHHCPLASNRKAFIKAFSDPYVVIYRHSGGMATFDFDNLTRLVFLAHDACIRVDLGGGKGGRLGELEIMFHDRKREGGMSERHPTLEAAVAAWRSRNAAPEEAT